jgi:hypothetical protein
MMLLNLTSLALVALTGTASPATGRTVHPVVADSGTTVALSADQLTNYISLKKELVAFWQAPEHAEALKAAQASGRNPNAQIGSFEVPVLVYDYPQLTKKYPDLAAIFKKNNFAPEQFEKIQVASVQAIGTLALAEANQIPLPANSTQLGKNVELVKAHRAALEAVGVKIEMQGGGGGGMGNDDDMNP